MSELNHLYGTDKDPRNITLATHRYACNGLPRNREGYYAQDGWTRNGDGKHHPHMVFIEDHMSKECRYDRKRTDPGCVGCLERDKPVYEGQHS